MGSNSSCASMREPWLGSPTFRAHAVSHLLTLALNVYLYVIVPKGFFPQQDTGRLNGNIHWRSETLSFQSMQPRMTQLAENRAAAIRQSIPLQAFSGGRWRHHHQYGTRVHRAEAAEERRVTADQIIIPPAAEAGRAFLE